MGAFVKAGQLRPLDAYAKAYGWNERYPESVLPVLVVQPGRQDVRARATSTACRRSARSSASTTTPRSSPAAGLQPPKTWAEFEAALATAKAKGEVPMHVRQPRQVAGDPRLRHGPGPHHPRRRRSRSSPSAARAPRGRRRRTPRPPQTLVDWVDKGYFEPGFNGQGYDPAWQAFSKGKGVFLIAGHLAAGRPAEGHGQRRRLHAAARRQRPTPSRSRPVARACRSRSPARARTRTRPRRTSTSSPTPTR